MIKVKSSGEYKPIIRSSYSPSEGQELQIGGRVIGTNILDKFSYFFIRAGGTYFKTKWDNSKSIAEGQEIRKGDLVEVRGIIKKQTSGDLYLDIESVESLTKCRGMLPNADYSNAKQDHCAIKAMFDPKTYQFFERHAQVVSDLRFFLGQQGFMEVSTPTLIDRSYSSKAREFVTRHGDKPYFLKKINEPRVKMYLLAGFERVFEISKIFRNEGEGAQLIPEFTNADILLSYTSYDELIQLGRNVFQRAASIFGVDCGDIPIVDVRSFGLSEDPKERMQDFKKKVAKQMKHAFIAQGYPSDNSPQAQKFPDDPSTSQEFRLFFNGVSFMHAYMFDTSPESISNMLEQQKTQRPDLEGKIWTAFDEALSYGMPPSGGIGLGIEKMIQMLSGKQTVKEVLFYRR